MCVGRQKESVPRHVVQRVTLSLKCLVCVCVCVCVCVRNRICVYVCDMWKGVFRGVNVTTGCGNQTQRLYTTHSAV